MKDSTKTWLVLASMWMGGYLTARGLEVVEAQAYKRGFNSALNNTGEAIKAVIKNHDEETEEKEEE